MKRLVYQVAGRARPAAIILLLWTTLLSFAWLRFRPETVPSLSPPVARRALTSRLAYVVLDGLRDDLFRALLPRTAALARQRGVLCPVQTPTLTFTVTGIYGLGTGDVPTLSLVPNNFSARRLDVDSLPGAAVRSGKRAVLFGEPVWKDLFGSALVAGETRRDLGPYVTDWSASAELGFFQGLRSHACELCIWHDASFDKVGHRHGVFGDGYVAYARKMDADIARAVDDAGPETTWFVT